MHKILIAGFLGKDPEEKFTKTGTKVTSFSVAVTVARSTGKETVWYKVNCWKDTFSKILTHLKKGSCVIIAGDLSVPRAFVNKAGETGIDLTISCDSITFPPSSGKKDQEKTTAISNSSDDDDLREVFKDGF